MAYNVYAKRTDAACGAGGTPASLQAAYGSSVNMSKAVPQVPIGYIGSHQIRPQKYPFPWTDPQTPLPHPWTRPTMPNGIRIRFAVFFTMHWTDRPTHRPTDRPRESLMTIARYASNDRDADK